MNFEKKLPPEIEQRWQSLRDQFEPLEITENRKLVKLWKLDNQSLIAISLIVFISLALAWIWWSAGKYQPAPPPPFNEVFEKAATPVAAATSPTANSEIYIHIYGEVLNPGVYSLPFGSRVFHALARAGGQTSNREITINLAQTLNDGDQIFIGEAATIKTESTNIPSNNQVSGSNCLNLNSANATALDTLPGIGPVMSQKIIDWREANGGFKNISDLKKVKGIGEAKFKEIEPLVCI